INRMADAISESVAENRRKDELRRELIASVAHDLRGPVTVVTAFAESLAGPKSHLEEEKRGQYRRGILAKGTPLMQLLSELVDLAKLEAKDQQLQIEGFSINELAEELAGGFQPLAQERHVTLSVRSEEPSIFVAGDSKLIARALRNLVENALRYTPA